MLQSLLFLFYCLLTEVSGLKKIISNSLRSKVKVEDFIWFEDSDSRREPVYYHHEGIREHSIVEEFVWFDLRSNNDCTVRDDKVLSTKNNYDRRKISENNEENLKMYSHRVRDQYFAKHFFANNLK